LALAVVLKQVELLVGVMGRGDGRRHGRDAEVIQNPFHCGACCDEGEQNHRRPAARALVANVIT